MTTTVPTVPERVAGQYAGRRGYLNAATLGLPCAGTLAALADGIAEWNAGGGGPTEWDGPVQRSRALFGQLVGVPADRVAVGSQVSVAVGVVAASVPAGSSVLCVEGDFTSVIYPFLVQAERGVRVRCVPHAELLAAVRPGVDWVAVSAVQSAGGEVLDLAALADRATAAGARVLLDATQAAGWLPLDANRFDVVTAGGYKWLSNPRGTCFTTVRPDVLALLSPHTAGWYAGHDVGTSFYGSAMLLAADARRLDVSPAWFSWMGAVPALELLAEVGVPAIHAHAVALADGFRARLGLAPTGSAIVSVAADDAVRARLAAAGVRCAARAGRVRLAFHLWNDEADVDLAAAAWGG